MEIVLQKLDLLDILNGTSSCPDATIATNANAVRDWKDKDSSARLELLLHMDDAQKQAVRTLIIANATWVQLRDTYEHTDVSTQVGNLKLLVNQTMSDDQDVEKFIQTWRLAMDDVTLLGLDLPPRVQAILLLGALPSSWQAYISTKATSANLTFPILIPAIIQEQAMYHKLSSGGAASSSSSQSLALYANPRNRYNPRNKSFTPRAPIQAPQP
ncbi:hypothetical protein GOP47_0008096 [Adiantum capillus-veneris]|uniref:Retrovirus-related Pol polyprotein from transposon TNT 1-94 n=1 Tax=Adiantum capillus-veneris TaxID=13818 RepID=A0A9D4ZK44_ADICA|nr:hypothetical protein GOP47_0008096 [Adiantum capillus-veneris]